MQRTWTRVFRVRVAWVALVVLTGCVSSLASGPWPSSSDRELVPLDHPSWDAHNRDVPPDSPHRIVFFGDQRALADGEWQAMIDAIVDREDSSADRAPLLGVIDSGDIVFDGKHRDQFDMLAEILRPLRPWPYLVGIGNHEVDSNRDERARRNVVEFLGPTVGDEFAVDRMYYRKEAPGHHLLFLDSNDLVYGADGRHGSDPDLDERGQQQMQWLLAALADIAEGPRDDFVTVILHHPFIISSTKHEGNARKLWSLRYQGRTLPAILADGGVDLVIAGHTHTYERFEVRHDSGQGFALVNVSGRPRGAFLGFGKGGRKARDIRGRELADLAARGWQDLDGWTVVQRDAMVDVEADQWLELRVAPGRAMVGELFYLREDRRATSRGSFVLR